MSSSAYFQYIVSETKKMHCEISFTLGPTVFFSSAGHKVLYSVFFAEMVGTFGNSSILLLILGTIIFFIRHEMARGEY